MKRLEMRTLLLSLALTLSACVAARAQAGAGGLERRDFDPLVGPVHTTRDEVAKYVRQDGALVEGPRRLVASTSYSEDGKRRDCEIYAEDGTVRQRSVSVYDDAGRFVEQLIYTGRDNLLARVVSRPDAGEVLSYDGEGNLRERVVTESRSDGVTETRTYDGGGALLRRAVVERGGGRVVKKTYDANGTLRGEKATSRVQGGARVEDQRYDAGGARGGRMVSTGGGSGEKESVIERPDGTQSSKSRETRELDSRGNVVKQVTYVWDAAAGDFAPSTVSYTTITYYR